MTAPAIDAHAHVLVPEALRAVADRPEAVADRAREERGIGPESVVVHRAMIETVAPKLADLDVRLADMDAAGIDVQLVSPMPAYQTWTEPDLAARLAAITADGVAEQCAKAPGRLVGLGIAPLHHPDVAVEALRYAMGPAGLRGMEIPSRAGERELSDPALEPFWAEAARLGAVIFLHPLGCSITERLPRWYLTNIVGHPLEHAVALSHLIFSGVLDRHPDLKILAAHGGGYLPVHIGRSDHGWRTRPDARGCAEPPSAYLRRMWFDGLVHDPGALRALVAAVGPDRVVLGSDYPFDMGSPDPIADLSAAGLPAETARAIRGGNALRLLGDL